MVNNKIDMKTTGLGNRIMQYFQNRLQIKVKFINQTKDCQNNLYFLTFKYN